MDREEKYVFHGSPELFDVAVPKQQRRVHIKNGNWVTVFDEMSFHATPHLWVALAYMYQPSQKFVIDEQSVRCNIGVALFKNTKTVIIHGAKSLEQTLKKLYGRPGYLYIFDKEKFFHQPELGNLEMITKEPLKPLYVEKIADPVKEMRELGVSFQFIDLTSAENDNLRELIS